MTGSLRKSARSPLAVGLMGVLILVFLLLGVGGGGRLPDAFRGTRADAVVSAGEHSVSASDFRRIFDQQKQRFEAESKQQLTAEQLARQGMDQGLLQAISSDVSLVEWLARSGIRPDPSLVDAKIREIPAAFDRVTGKFSEKQFLRILAEQGMTPQRVQSDFTDELAQRHFSVAAEAGFRAPRAFAAVNAIRALESRDASWFVVQARAVVQPAAPTDADLTAFMQAHAAQLTNPEMRRFDLVRISAQALTPTVSVNEADVKKAFDARQATLSTPEIRTVVQIPLKSASDAQKTAQRLTAGEDPMAVARSVGAEPVLYSNKPKTAFPDPAVAAAAFGMKAGEVRGPVQSEFGPVVLKVVTVTPAKIADYAAAKAGIQAELRAKAARDKAYEISQKFDEARQGGSSVADAAKKAGLPLTTIGPISAQGSGPDGAMVAGLDEKLLKVVFQMRAGEESDLEDLGGGEYYAVKVQTVTPPALPALDSVRKQLTGAYIREKLFANLKAKAESLSAELRQGKPIEAVAASVEGRVVRQSDMKLLESAKYNALGSEMLRQIFTAKAGDVFIAGAPDGAFVGRLDAVHAADAATAGALVNGAGQKIAPQILQDLVAATKQAATDSVHASTNLTLARTSIGVDPAAFAAKDKSKGPAK